MHSELSAPDEFCTVLSDALIPGDGHFPSASEAGVVARFEARLRDLRGASHLGAIQDALSVDGSFVALDEAQRNEALAALEQSQHALFEEMLAVLYFSYYESPVVTVAIRQSGLTYHNPPQPIGYRMSVFDPSNPLELPSHNRGHYVPTEAVRRVDLSELAHLAASIDRPSPASQRLITGLR